MNRQLTIIAKVYIPDRVKFLKTNLSNFTIFYAVNQFDIQ